MRVLHRQRVAPHAVERFKRAGHSGRGRDKTDFADAFRPQWALGLGVLHQNHLDFRHVARAQHTKVLTFDPRYGKEDLFEEGTRAYFTVKYLF